jgi:hypothetical protein
VTNLDKTCEKMNLRELLNIVKTELKDLSPLENPDFRLEQAEFQKDSDI